MLALAYWLANRMSATIRQLEDGAKRIGTGQFDYRIAISSWDELERLARRLNRLAGDLAKSKQKSDRINRLKKRHGSQS
jgi:nitrate/nitrite-specific signal transduction histidine kinase